MGKITAVLLALPIAIWLSGCSSNSMPSIPWWDSAAKPDPTAEALYEEGTHFLAEKRYARAIDTLTKLKTEHPFSPQLTDAELKIADAYYLNEQYPDAINAFKEFQAMHPTNENIPFVIYRLGQAHLDQFTSIERDQKNTELAIGYFENVLTNYPKSPYANAAREQLGKSVGYLAEHDFSVASFYFQQEKYPAARERFEEIVRKYPGTPVAARSLFLLGESYRKETNNVKAALAYEALIQHYPENKLAAEAKTQLAQVEKEKQDPLAMLLMRDRRPIAVATGGTTQQTANNQRVADVDNLIAKKEIVYEEPGDEKGIFSRVADKLNPFSSSDEKKKPESATELLAKNASAKKEETPGVLGSLWSGINPFDGQNSTAGKTPNSSKSPQLVDQIDDSLKQKGIDSASQTASLKPPAAALPKAEEIKPPPPQTMDTGKLLGDIDANLQKSGKNLEQAPPPPEAHAAFKDGSAAAATKPNPAPPQDVVSGGLLSSIDQKLKSQGIEPTAFEAAPAPSQSSTQQEQVRKVELAPKVAVEKGPLFLPQTEIPAQGKRSATEAANLEKKSESSEKRPTPVDQFPRTLVKGPVPAQPQPVAKVEEQRLPGDEQENKGIFDQLKNDADRVNKMLNPFQW
jgi:outer membrane protein assembly factor BamD